MADLKTRRGRKSATKDIAELSREAEAGYDPAKARARKEGRP